METRNENMTVINDVIPFAALHPGSILGEELKARGISQKEFAERIGLQATHLSALIHGARNITPAVAAKLESGLGDIPAEMWLRLQNQYNVDVQRKRLRPSTLVSGYSASKTPAMVLAEPDTTPAGKLQVRITLPRADKDLLVSLASRFGWIID